MTSLFAFPNPVNEVSARLVAAGVVVMATVAVVADQPWLTAVIAYGFVARVLAGPRFSPLGRLVTQVVTPLLPVPARPVPGPPKRFAQGIGAMLTVPAAALALGGHWDAGRVLLGAVIAAATLEAVFGFCVGCRIFAGLIRAGLVPTAVCLECADLGRRLPGGAGA